MLAVKASRFVELVEKKQKLEREKDLLRQFRSRKQQLQEAVAGLAGVCVSYNLMQNEGVACPDMSQTVSQALTMADIKFKLFEEKPEWILDTTDFQSFQRTMKSAVDTVHKNLLEFWKTHVQSLLPQIQQETLAVFRIISSFRDDIEKMEHHLQFIQAIAARLPLQVSEIKQLQERSEALHAIWNKFGQGNLPDEVLHFLKLAGSPSGAPIHLWTHEVITWLNGQGIITQCKIRI